MSEFADLYEVRLNEMKKVKDRLAVIRSLEQHPGWLEYQELLKAQILERRESFELTTVTGVDELVGREFPRGEMAGMMFASEILKVEREALATSEIALQEEIDRFAKIEEEDESNGG